MRPPFINDASEFDDIGQIENIGVDLGFADRRAVKPCFGINVEPAQVGPQGGAVLELVIHPDLNGETEPVFQLKRAQRRFLLEERGVMHTSTDIGLERAVGREVIVQRDGGRQMLGCTGKADACNVDVMLERGRGEQLDPEIVAEEVFCGDGRADIVADIGFATCKSPVSGFWHNDPDTQTKGELALRLRSSGSGGSSSDEERDKCVFHDSVPIRIHKPNLRCGAAQNHDLDQGRTQLIVNNQILTHNPASAA